MPAVTRLGDVCTGHACYPSRPSTTASPDVYVNGIAVHRHRDLWSTHCCGADCHGGALARGSLTVFVNDRMIGRIGDPVNCGSAVAQGSDDVFAGG